MYSQIVPVLSCNGSSLIMDALDYDSLLHNTKDSLCNKAQIKKLSFPNHFTVLLEDCRLCITQSLDFVVNILSDSNILPSKLAQYMENAVSLLQMLSDLIKNVVESISMSCCTFKTFPTATGHIIMLVFTHCKNSEAVYGAQLKNVQMQLKDLFRSCHELQLTYLMVLEKHFIFDLTEREQLEIIVEALDINLKIGELVQSLDVKTMAEQWKAYTALCEKYSSHLNDKLVYQQCTQTLCAVIMNNLKTALEVDQDEKVIMRSLKVTNFIIKIMVKMCIIFKHALQRDNSQIIEMLISIYLNSQPCLKLEGKPTQLINGMITNVLNPSDILLSELIQDKSFFDMACKQDIKRLSNDEKLHGYILFIVSMMKSMLQNGDKLQCFSKSRILECVFKVLPDSHVILNIGLRFQNELNQSNSCGLFEYMLTYTTALSLTLDAKEMSCLESMTYEAILGTECVTALFASCLWTAIARISNNSQLLLIQMHSLCKMYQKLENHNLFSCSPQKLYLSHTLLSLFECMRPDYKIKLSRQFNPMDSKNMSLWTVLKIKNLPREVQRNIEEEILETYKHQSKSTLDTDESVDNLVKTMKLAASLSFSSVDDDVEQCVLQAWMKACPRKFTFLSKNMDSGRLWYFEYVEALIMLTRAIGQMFYQNSVNLVKVLHVISNIAQIGNTELNLLLIDLISELAVHPVSDENKHSITALVNESFRTILIQDCSKNNIVKTKLHRVIKRSDKRLRQIISSLVADDPQLQELWDNSFRFEEDKERFKEQITRVGKSKYVHKCIEILNYQESETVEEIQKTCSSNFDFADLDTLFDNESDSEQPVSKKMKLDGGEAQAVLNRIEDDVSLLCTLKENVFTNEHRRRIRDLCEKLKCLVD
ncbi:uncharacterized protein C1orf112 homolog isoform X1 [Ostrinia furnacalis]|uniref:uncharacterized protein C1orf112 homolog isoform X1 n=2 Tax=Ostrinia furnacalis TaxID=93504 RepID=UPI001039C0A1|nr:uncharacterized protein C1orf112 homolog isoform X1 [Ostrinia furnacalis]